MPALDNIVPNLRVEVLILFNCLERNERTISEEEKEMSTQID